MKKQKKKKKASWHSAAVNATVPILALATTRSFGYLSFVVIPLFSREH